MLAELTVFSPIDGANWPARSPQRVDRIGKGLIKDGSKVSEEVTFVTAARNK